MLSSNWAKALEPNISQWIHEGFNTYPDTTAEVFNIHDESSSVIRFHDSWGPRIIPKSSERAATTLLDKQKGYANALIKSSLINGENLIVKAKATLKNLYNLILNLQENKSIKFYWACRD